MKQFEKYGGRRLQAVEQLISQLEISDRALGAHLSRCAARVAGGMAAVDWAFPPAWYRARISEWCADPTVRTTYGHEAVTITSAAMADLEDELLQAFAEDLIDAAADDRTRDGTSPPSRLGERSR